MLRISAPDILVKLAVAACSSTLVGAAMAVEFGPLQLRSSLAEPLRAEIEVRVQPGDVLDPGCIKVSGPSAKQLPAISGVTLSWLPGNSGLSLRTERPLAEPAMVLGLVANCGAGRVWQDFAVLLQPDGKVPAAPSSSEWVVAPGESPQSLAQLLYPRQPDVQRRFLQALAEVNPGLGIEANPAQALLVGSTLNMPDWRQLGSRRKTAHVDSVPRPAPPREMLRLTTEAPVAPVVSASSRRIKAPPESLSLRLSTTLDSRQDASDQLRQMLRLEYRLLTSLNEQLSALSVLSATSPVRVGSDVPVAPTEPTVRLQATPTLPAEVQAAPVTSTAAPTVTTAEPVGPPPASSPVSEIKAETPSAPIKIREVPPPQPAPVTDSDTDWLYYAGAGAVLLLLLALAMRRRRSALEPPVFESPETVVMERPEPAVSISSAGLEQFFAEPNPPQKSTQKPAQTPASKAPKSGPFPLPEDSVDINPVMELAEIMLSFGRIQGAAQTLQEYIEANPREALQPWVKLLDIYRAGDMHAEFDELAQKLNRNFNVELQHWDGEAPPSEPVPEDLPVKALSLEEMPRICEQIVAMWGRPECLDYLHQLLRDNRGGQRSGFALPVVQEILLLIEILVARQAAGSQ